MCLAHPVPQGVGPVHGLSLCVYMVGEQAPVPQGVGVLSEAVFHHVPGAPCSSGCGACSWFISLCLYGW